MLFIMNQAKSLLLDYIIVKINWIMKKSFIFILTCLISFPFAYANDCPGLKLAKKYIPKIISDVGGELRPIISQGKEIYKIEQLSENNYLVTGGNQLSFNLEETCGMVNFNLPFSIKEKNESGENIVVHDSYTCEGVLKKNKKVLGNCMAETLLSNGNIFMDTLTFKWRPR